MSVHSQDNLARRWLAAVFFSLALLAAGALSCAAQENSNQQHPANFVFLIDVSGSMVSKKTMVAGANGQQITLFEALRQALQQIVADDRILTPQSKVAFVTFGTAITDKDDWPASLDKPENRTTLVQKVSSPEELQADKHGDTYMGGALDRAYEKATALSEHAEPCTTCFIVMLTDGWDEPPAGATLHVRDVAARIVQKQQDLRKKLGVNTWQVRVVGLQRLPDRKAGTTTAAELARLVGGEFLDVTKSSSGTVSQRIYSALDKTIHDLEGKVELSWPRDDAPIAHFGTLEGGKQASAMVPVNSGSCYGEKVTSATDITSQLSAVQTDAVKRAFSQLKDRGALKDVEQFATPSMASELPAGALRVGLDHEVLLAPVIDQITQGTKSVQQMKLVASVSAACPPGVYIGAVKPICTAKFDQIVPYTIVVPSRIVTDTSAVTTSVRKPGFLFTKPTSAALQFAVATRLAGHDVAPEEVVIEPDAGKATASTLDKALINGGRNATVKLNMSEKSSQQVVLPVEIPADQKPGTYRGLLHIKLPQGTNIIAPADLQYTLEVLPSPWEQVSPIAVPIMILLAVVLVLWLVVWIASKRS